MASKTAKLQIVIAGKNKDAVGAIRGTGKELGLLKGQLSGLGRGIGGFLSVAAVTAYGKAAVSSYDKQAGSVSKIKRLTGETAEQASLLAFATQQAGLDADKLSTSWGIAATNIKKGKFDAAGIATKDDNGNAREFNDILLDTADLLASLPPGYERTAKARELFGKGGADVAKILGKGSAALAEQRAEMEKLGLSFSAEDLKKYAEFKDSQRDLSAASIGLKTALAKDLVPAVKAVDDVLTKVIPHVSDAFGSVGAVIDEIPGPVLGATAVAGGLAVAVGGLTIGLGLAKGALVSSLETLGLWTPTAAEAAVATEAVTVADGEMSVAAFAAARAMIAEQAAADELALALFAVGASAEDVALLTAGMVTSDEAATVAMTEEASAARVAGETLGGLGAAIGSVVAGWLAYQQTTGFLHDHFNTFHGDVQQLKSDLADIGGPDGATAVFEDIGGSVDGFISKVENINSDNLGRRIKDIVHLDAGDVTGLRQAQADLGALDTQLADMAKTDPGQAAAKFQELAVAYVAAGGDLEDLVRVLPKYGTEADKHRSKVDGQKQSMDGAASAAKHFADALALTDRATQGQAAFDQLRSLDAATQDVADATNDLATAERAARGDSDEYRSAVKAEADDLRQLADDERAVTSAKEDARQAQRDLNDARKEAKQRLDDLAEAVVNAADKERDAKTAAKRAAQELERANAGNGSALDKEEAQNAAIDAQHAAEQAARDHAGAIAENNAAQAAGVEGDKQVVSAKQKVADANQAIVDSEQKVKDQQAKVAADGVAKSQILKDAAGDVKAAHDRVNETLLTQAKLIGDVVNAQKGPLAGWQAQLDALDSLYDKLDPASPLAKRVADFMAAIRAAIAFDVGNAPQPPSTGNRESTGGPGGPGGKPSNESSGGPGGPGRNLVVNITNIHQGTSTQQRRAHEQAARRTADAIARASR